MAGETETLRLQSPFVKSFTCKNCGAAVTVRNQRDSIVAICQSCKATIDLSDPNFSILAKAREQVNYEPLIPLGSRGKLNDKLWEVIGYLQRSDLGSDYTWEEYLLFNPYYGYRWLTQAQGHWNFVTMIKERPAIGNAQFNPGKAKAYYQGRGYKLFFKGRAQITAVLGEFYWRISVGEVVEVEDYILPPYLLSVERDVNEQNWSLSEYIEPEEIRKTFDITGILPLKIGVAPNQPPAYTGQTAQVMGLWALFLAVIIVLQFAHLLTATNETSFYQRYYYGNFSRRSIVTPSFELGKKLDNVLIQVNAPVSGTWLSIDGELVNDQDGKSYPFNETVEYYSGYDGGESWSEGSTTKSELFSFIPGGTYHLDFDVSAAGPADVSRYVQAAPSMDYEITVKRGVPNWSNFLWAFFLLALMPLWVWWRKHSFEVNRWSTSDYSPYASGDDD